MSHDDRDRWPHRNGVSWNGLEPPTRAVRVRRRPRYRTRTWRHTCPDGTPVTVTAQFIGPPTLAPPGQTLYRWRTATGSWPTSHIGDTRHLRPDWTAIDARHRLPAPVLSPVTAGRSP